MDMNINVFVDMDMNMNVYVDMEMNMNVDIDISMSTVTKDIAQVLEIFCFIFVSRHLV